MKQDATSARSADTRRRTGARDRKRRRAAAAPPPGAGARRRILTYRLLDKEGLDVIVRTTDWILEGIGIEFRGDADALALWRKADTDVQGERVRFAPGFLPAIIAESTPRSFTRRARNPERSAPIGEDNVVFASAYGAPFVHDMDDGRRYGTLADFGNLVKLTCASPWLHHSEGTVCEPVDRRHLDMVYAHLRYSKPFMGSVTTPERAEDSIERAASCSASGSSTSTA